jgi:phage tail-like protein
MAEYNVATTQNFQVEIDGISYGNFISVSGLGVQADVSDDIGGMDVIGRKVAGKVNYGPVTLVRNWDPTDKQLQDWWKKVESPGEEPEIKNISIVIKDKTNTAEVIRRNLMQCLPSGYEISDLNSNESSIMTETITVVFDTAEYV